MTALTSILDDTENQAQSLASGWSNRLTDDDRQYLVAAFHRAEYLAQCALETSIDQVSEGYRAELVEQLADEERHVDVFAQWQAGDVPTIPKPRVRQRSESVWFALLLINEAAGYCQFHMLMGLLDEGEQREAVAGILADERVHIARLQRWLAAYRGKPAHGQVMDIIASFRKKLPGRMTQFLPRDELAPLRQDMALLVDGLIEALMNAPAH